MTEKENDVHNTSTEEKKVNVVENRNETVAPEDKEAQKAIAKAKAHTAIDEGDDILVISFKEIGTTESGVKIQQQVISFGRTDRLAKGIHNLVTQDSDYTTGFKMAMLQKVMGM